ncbi:MAG: hypothetical protein ACYSTZ_00085 [Planctomycetota bacterium]|jgi:hypothetical protein
MIFHKKYRWDGEPVKEPDNRCRSKKYAVNTDLVNNERWSDSMGVQPHQIPEAMQIFPGSTYDSEGRLLIKNRKHKLFEAKRRGYAELD